MISIVLTLALAGTPVERPKDATAQYIRVLRPDVSARRAARLGAVIDYWAKKYDLDPDLMTAIIQAESRFETGIQACWPAPWKAADEITKSCQPKEKWITCDHGLAQINEVWIHNWGLDKDKLLHDDAYNIAIQARLLYQLKKEFGDAEPEDWYGRYNSSLEPFKTKYLDRLAGFLAMR